MSLANNRKEVITIDLENNKVSLENGGEIKSYDLSEPQSFSLISKAWLRCGWDNKYVYSFSWLGRPIIQLPEDMVRMQELIFSLKPDVIIETGVAHGGSLVFYAGLCKILEKGRVIGIDIEIRPHNRKAIESHFLFPFITLVEGDSVAPSLVEKVKAEIKTDDKVLVLLDSCHTKDHVLAELNAYAPLVPIGSYIIAMDGIMEELVGAPRTEPDWSWNNPKRGALEFVRNNPNFIIEEPQWLFNEGNITERITYWPNAFIKRVQ
jgi:cephalosporin hydroxylase